jgi:hypothetical protein
MVAAGTAVLVGDDIVADGCVVGRGDGSTVCDGVLLLSELDVGVLVSVAATATTAGLVAVGVVLGWEIAVGVSVWDCGGNTASGTIPGVPRSSLRSRSAATATWGSRGGSGIAAESQRL